MHRLEALHISDPILSAGNLAMRMQKSSNAITLLHKRLRHARLTQALRPISETFVVAREIIAREVERRSRV